MGDNMARNENRTGRLKHSLRLFAITAGLVWMPVASAAETLTDALIGAYTHSGLLEQNRAVLRAADEDVAQAMAALRPVVRYSATQSYSSALNVSRGNGFSTSVQISAGLLLYDFGASQFAIDGQKETVLGTRQALIGVEQQVLSRAVSAFMNMRRTSEFVALRQNNVRLITQEFRAAQDRFEVGEVTRTDVALAEARLAAARSGLAAAQGDLARSAAEYRAAVGRAPGTLQAPSNLPQIPSSASKARTAARVTHPDILQAQHTIRTAELNVLRAEAALKPTIELGGSVSVDKDLNDTASLSIELAGPISQGGRLNSVIRQAMANRDRARASLHVIRHAVDQGVENAYANLSVAQASREASERQIRAARVAFRGVREEATLGARTTLDVLDAEQELLNAEASRISAISDQYIAAYSVLAAMGLLTVDHLRLGVQTYDPTAYYNLVKSAPAKHSKQGKALDRVLKSIGKN